MNKLILAILLIVVITNIYAAGTDKVTCLTKKTETETGGETETETGGETETETETGTETETETETDPPDVFEEIRRRRLKTLTAEDCKFLDTTDNSKYKCVLNSDKISCKEVKKEDLNGLKVSFTILCLLFFI